MHSVAKASSRATRIFPIPNQLGCETRLEVFLSFFTLCQATEALLAAGWSAGLVSPEGEVPVSVSRWGTADSLEAFPLVGSVLDWTAAREIPSGCNQPRPNLRRR